MTSRYPTLVGLTVVLGASAWGAGCYNPDIKNQLHCATPPATKSCPDGYQCSGQLCVKIGAVGSASGGSTGTGGEGTGGVNGSGGAGTGGARLREEFESCLLRNEGTANQTDDCNTALGLTCLSDCASHHCFRGCQTDGECPRSSCSRTFDGTSGKFCERPYTACNPAMPKATSCTNPQVCNLLSSQAAPGGGDQTVCDCEGGPKARGEPCSRTRDCFAGMVCPPASSGLGSELCQVVCDPMAGASACAAGTCRPFGARWGFCS